MQSPPREYDVDCRTGFASLLDQRKEGWFEEFQNTIRRELTASEHSTVLASNYRFRNWGIAGMVHLGTVHVNIHGAENSCAETRGVRPQRRRNDWHQRNTKYQSGVYTPQSEIGSNVFVYFSPAACGTEPVKYAANDFTPTPTRCEIIFSAVNPIRFQLDT